MTSHRLDSKKSSIWRRIRVSRVGVTVGIVAFLVLSGTGAYAYWSVGAAMQTSASAGTLAVTSTWTSSLGATFTNVGELNTGKSTKTGEITVSNTTTSASTLASPYSVALAFTGATPGPLATKLAVTVWKKSGSCSAVGSPSYTGTWGSPPAISGNLAAGNAQVWCIRTVVAERSDVASASGSVSLTPTVTATLTAGTSWSKTSTLATGSLQKTEFIYPAAAFTPGAWMKIFLTTNPSRCLDILGSGGSGTELIEWGCTLNPNQQFSPGVADANGYFSVTPRHSQTMSWSSHGSSTVGAGISLEAASSSSSQAWQFQQTATDVYQIVNKYSGLCIAPGPVLSGGQIGYIQSVCDGSAAQRFTVAPAQAHLILECSGIGDKKEDADVKYTWDSGFAGAYTFQAFDGGWKTIGTSAANANTVIIDGTQPTTGTALESWSQGDYLVRALDSNNNTVGTGSITVEKKKALACS